MNERKKAFTKLEIIVTITVTVLILGFASFSALKIFNEKQIVNNLISLYESIDKATKTYMGKNNCVDDIAKCLSKVEGKEEWEYMDTSKYFKGIADNLDIADSACNNNYSGKEWLSDTPATLLDGSTQTEAWEAPTKAFTDAYQNANCYYLFKNGAVMHVQFPDNQKQSGFGTIDINGKKGPNRVGADIFPLGWGAAGNKEHWASKGLNPFWAEDGYATMPDDPGQNTDDYNFEGVQTGLNYRGMCRISCPHCDCKADKSSPTYYVIKNKRLPEL